MGFLGIGRVCVGAALGALVLAAGGPGIPCLAFAETYQYDAAGRISRVVYDTGQVVDYIYDRNSNVTGVVSGGQLGVDPGEELSMLETSLGQGSPNPATRTMRLRFTLAEGGDLRLRFFDVAGREVFAIERTYAVGSYEVQVNVERWAAGVYFYRMEVGEYAKTRKMVVVQ